MTGCLIRPLDAAVAPADFHCGQKPLDDYIQRYASQDVRRNLARVFVVMPAAEPMRLAAFYTVSAGRVACLNLPQTIARKLPRYPVPVALVGRLAVDSLFQGKGLGSILLADACRRVAGAASVLAVAGIIVDARDAAAAAFYRHHGFVPLPGNPDRLLLPAAAFLSE